MVLCSTTVFTSRRTALTLAPLLFAGVILAFPTCGVAETYGQPMDLQRAPSTTKVSGYKGQPFTLASTREDHALTGLESSERRDNPCDLTIFTESINDSSNVDEASKRLCGASPTSYPINAAYTNTGINEKRLFVSGLRVCTNNKETRVKGFQLRGKKISDDGKLSLMLPEKIEWVAARLSGGGGLTWSGFSALFEPKAHDDPMFPAMYRNNCKEWHEWVECPNEDEIATSLVAHFEAGKEPRSLTGIALVCRRVGKPYLPAGDRP
jgi:hypothetical protein